MLAFPRAAQARFFVLESGINPNLSRTYPRTVHASFSAKSRACYRSRTGNRAGDGTSKAGLAHLTKQLAVELASLGIRVNAVAPGPVDTAMAKAVHTPEIRADYHDAIPLNRYGLEEELAEAIFFLSSDRASYITGQVLAVDGGFDAAGIGLPTLRGQRRNG
jgi:NAD(P)-dependent dehydrogenase (short-subunit alcohol dehydrogenase family)